MILMLDVNFTKINSIDLLYGLKIQDTVYTVEQLNNRQFNTQQQIDDFKILAENQFKIISTDIILT